MRKRNGRGARARFSAALRVGLALLVLLAGACDGPGAGRRIVLIGGSGSEGPGRHAYADGVRRLAAMLGESPQGRGAQIIVFEQGWPADSAALRGASTVVLYFDGLDRHPLLDPAHREQLRELVGQGVGLVALHQASTVPAGDASLDLRAWLGAERVGMFDRTTETATVSPADAAHPITRGVDAFTYRDEFYPTLRFAASGVRPVLRSTLHAQYRDGAAVVEDRAETVTVGWAYERPDGGRSFGYSGAHFLDALEQPMLRRVLLNAILWTADIEVPDDGAPLPVRVAPASPAAALTSGAVTASVRDVTTFHADRQRSGWHRQGTGPTRAQLEDPSFDLLWESPPLDAHEGQPPRLYASPLYLEQVRMSDGQHRGQTFKVVFAASNHGYVYAINAGKAGDVAPGRILWRTRLAPPCHLQPAPLDAVPTGVLSTPVIDTARGRIYVTSCDPKERWQAYALDIGSGKVIEGWPVRLDEARFNAVNANAGPVPVPPKRRFDFRVQRGALNLSPDGSRLYVTFGETETGWLVAVDTLRPRVASAFAAVAMPHRGSGGIWGAGGPAVDAAGDVFVVTGSGFDGYRDQPHDWTQSVLKLSDSAADGLRLRGTYTPFNHCGSAKMDIDLGSGGASLLADLDPAQTATTRLMVVGGKQGNAYLLDRDHLPGKLDRRPVCGTDAASDGSLLAPSLQPQFGGRGPLNVFGPYSEQDAAMDQARGRSVPAYHQDEHGAVHVYMTGNTRRAEGAPDAVPPSLVKLRVVTAPGQPAHLAIARRQMELVFINPGSPVISSDGARDPIVWVLDENARRSAPLAGTDAPAPVLYALEGHTLELLWKSAPGQLRTSGKYNEPVFAQGVVVVGTDRIQAFGPGAPVRAQPRMVDDAAESVPQAPVAADSGLDGEALFKQRCAVCHDHPQGNIPPRAMLESRSRAYIVDTLTHGAMRAQAAGLSANDIDAIAGYLDGD
ncbi:ThuA domain-containing protein [Pseudomonas sp. R2.Fl]|nr:ThuA domain-containing protein [Pseudomonas sp. R2.Fl]